MKVNYKVYAWKFGCLLELQEKEGKNEQQKVCNKIEMK
jgi:hypothetical protein